jgi:hypothetical protein
MRLEKITYTDINVTEFAGVKQNYCNNQVMSLKNLNILTLGLTHAKQEILRKPKWCRKGGSFLEDTAWSNSEKL